MNTGGSMQDGGVDIIVTMWWIAGSLPSVLLRSERRPHCGLCITVRHNCPTTSGYNTRVLLQGLILLLAQKLSTIYGSRSIITVLITSLHFSLSSARKPPVRTLPNYSFKIHFNITLPYKLMLSTQSPSFRFHPQNPLCITPLLYALTCPNTLSLLDFITQISDKDYKCRSSIL